MTYDADCVVVGAGVVGLAIAREIAAAGASVLVLERAENFGTETSSRNSEVIHAGLYHASDTLKALLCVRGREMLYAYCQQRGIAHRQCGKLVVAATQAQMPALRKMHARGVENGVPDLQLMHGAAARALEPALSCHAALLSPATGIVDSHALMLALLGDAEAAGARLICRAAVQRVARDGTSWVLHARGTTLRARMVVQSAGLGGQALAANTAGFAAARIAKLHLAKGSYFSLSGQAPFTRLIYPVPEMGGAGIHLTLDIAGQARFGPDVEWVDTVDYRVDAGRAAAFAAAIRTYWPEVPEAKLHPAYAGIRPKLAGPPEGGSDFAILGPPAHGLPGLVALLGIESPGLTACLAIAAHVAGLLGFQACAA